MKGFTVSKKTVQISSFACLGLLFLGIVLASILIGIAVKKVENDEVALVYNTISKSFDYNQTPLQQGRYFLPIGTKLFKFKRTFQLKSLEGNDSVDCVTRDGLEVNLEVTFQYRIKQDKLTSLFLLTGEDFENLIELQTLAAIRDTCGKWTSSDFYYQRQQVQDDIGQSVDTNLNTIYCDGGFLQLVNVKFDQSFVSAIQQVQVSSQDIIQALNERAQVITQAQTVLLQAEQTANIILIKARAEAQVRIIQANNEAQSINATMSSQKTAFYSLKQTLNMGTNALIDYVRLQSYQKIKRATIGVQQ